MIKNLSGTKKLCVISMIVLVLLLFNSQLFSQYIVKGRVTNENGKILGGATITEKGSNKTTISKEEGDFILNVSGANARLVVSYVEYTSTEIAVNNRLYIEVTLVSMVSNLDQVVVIGYGTAKKKDLTGSVASVSSKDFNKGIFTSPDQLIQGKVSGLQISNDNGQPGGASTIKIRGNAALTGTGQPLYVVDGVPLDGRTLQQGTSPLNGTSVQTGVNPLNFLNPEDIASIDVLKDASATAIYGSRAAYGVIIINTKKAQVGQAKLTASVSNGVSSVLKKIKVLNASQFRDAIKYYGADTLGNQLDKGGSFDAFDAILQKAIQQNYTIGITGGNETCKYRLSTNLLNQDGIIRNTSFKKYGLDLVTNFKFLESKKFGLDININSGQSIQEVPYPEVGAGYLIVPALRWNPTDTLRNADGSLKPGTRDNPNPVQLNEQLKNNFKLSTILASIAPSYKFTNWLEYKLLMSVNYSSGITRASILQDPVNNPRGTASITNAELTTRQMTHTLNFNKKITKELNLDAVTGFEYIEFTMKGSSLTGQGVGGTGFGFFGLDYTNYVQYSYSGDRVISSFIDPVTELKSFFGRAIFNFKDKYLLTGTFRADGSTKFGNNNKYGYFPSFAASWIISKEQFFTARFINSLKIRGGWGKTGNQEFPSGASQARYSFFDNGIIQLVNIPNPNLKWQTDKQYNVGLDFSIFNNRISGTLDYFNKSTTDLLFPGPPIQPSPPSSLVKWVNLDGKVINKGLEVSINGSIIRSEKIGWDLGFNASFLKNNVTGIPFPIYTGNVGSGLVQIIENGHPMQTFYTKKFLGIDKVTGLSDYMIDDTTSSFFVGNPNPNTLLGISSSFRYNKFTLTANMYGAFGQDIYNGTLMSFLNVGGIKGGGNIALSVFEDPVKESITNSQTPSSRYIMKGSYLKMANLTLSYAAVNVGKTFKGLNIFITGQNLFMITSYPGLDPESSSNTSNNNVPSFGIDFPPYPSKRTFIVGINFSL